MNDKAHNIDEMKLTAYALGELDPDDAIEIEQAIANDEALMAEVESIRATAQMLTGELSEEPAPTLTAEQRETVAQGPKDVLNHPAIFTMRARWAASGLAAAAMITLAIFVPAYWQSLDHQGAMSGDDFAINSPVESGVVAEMEESPASFRSESFKRMNSAGLGVDSSNEIIVKSLADPDQAAPSFEMIEGVEDILDRAMPSLDDPLAGLEKEEDAEIAQYRRDLSLENSQKKDKGDTGVSNYINRVSDVSPQTIGGGRGDGSRNTASPPPSSKPTQSVSHASPGGGGGAGGGGDSRGGIFGEPDDGFSTAHHVLTTDGIRGRENIPMRGDIPLIGEALFSRNFRDLGSEAYAPLIDNPWTRPVGEKALSTFSIDVDTASYANMRRFVSQGSLPPRDAVRIEEMVNYFKYNYAAPTEESEHPFAAHVEIADAPWNEKHRLVRIGLKGREVAMDKRPATNLVFLIDVSGSMQPRNKLPLLKQSMKMLVEHLNGDDTIAIVTYAGNSGLVLPATHCDARESILGAIDRLSAGGSTNGGAGIDLAYRLAAENFISGGINRVILATDGDFNVGVTRLSELLNLIENRRKTGVFLSVLGFGEGNIKDDKMELLADKGNGNYAYIDTLKEARKVLVEEATSTLMTIAKDVKIQVEFNPSKVGAYRLIGYANRILKAKDFNNDRIDAGEIGAGHTVTALYEIVPPGVAIEGDIDNLKYQQPAADEAVAEAIEVVESDELFTLKIRYKQPEAAESTKFEIPVIDEGGTLAEASDDFRFASAVAAYGMILRNSEYRGSADYEMVCELAGATPDGRIRGTAQFLADFVHYALTANIELAAANARALLNAELTDVELANLLRSGPTTFAEFDRAVQRAGQVPELAKLCDELAARVKRGSLQHREVMPLKPENTYRTEFIELVRKAAAISQPIPVPER